MVKSISLAGAFIRKEMKKKGFFLSREEIEDKKLDAVEYVLRRFKGDKQYFIKESFTSAIYFGVEHALYYRNKSQALVDEIITRMNCSKSLTYEEAVEQIKIKRYIKKKREVCSFLFLLYNCMQVHSVQQNQGSIPWCNIAPYGVIIQRHSGKTEIYKLQLFEFIFKVCSHFKFLRRTARGMNDMDNADYPDTKLIMQAVKLSGVARNEIKTMWMGRM